jgi:ribose transport system permease protein
MAEHRGKLPFRRIIGDWGLWIVFIGLVIVFGILQPRFLSFKNLWNLLRQAAPLGLVSAGQGIVLIGGRFDMSVGSIAAMSSVMMVYGVWNFGTIAGTLIGLAVGGSLGIINGLLIGKLRLNAFIATIATMITIRGAAFYITGGVPLHDNIPESMLIIGNGYVGPVPIPVIIAAGGFVILHVLLSRMQLGRSMYAVGGNSEAARLAGINLFTTWVWTFLLSGLFAAMVGVIYSSRLAIGAPNLGEMMPLESIAAAVIGGVSIGGGEGKALGVILGVLLLSIIRNGLNLYNVSHFVQMIVTGLIIIVAILIDRYRYRIST